MTNASTLGSMSPGLLKVVERARSEGRCDRAGAGGRGRSRALWRRHLCAGGVRVGDLDQGGRPSAGRARA